MRRIIIIVLFLFLLVGCQQTKEDNIEIIKDDTVKLKTGIINLLDEDNCSLEISYLGGSFFKTSDYFSARILELLSFDLEPEWKDININNHQIVFKFDGYKNIYIDTDLENFWFEGEGELFSIIGIKELWDRYVIKLIGDEPVYCEFEKTVFSKIDRDFNNDGELDEAILYYDGDIRLRINEKEVIIQEGVYPIKHIGKGAKYYNGSPMEIAGLEYIESLELFIYTFEGASVHGPFTNVSFYKYDNNKITKILYGTDCKIDNVNLDAGIVNLKFPFDNIDYKLKLNQKEIKKSKLIKEEIENPGGIIDENYLTMLRDCIIISEDKVLFEDYDGDGELELILLGRIETKFTSSYINIDESIVFVFDLYSDKIECVDIVMERDADNINSPFRYFR